MSATARSCAFCQEPLTERAAFCPTCGAATPTAIARDTGAVADREVPAAAAVADYRRRLQKALGESIELRGILGRGGFAEVYIGWDTRLKRELAVKALRPDLNSTPDLVERFRREAEAVANLRHPNIIPIYAVGEGEGVVFFTMPRIIGETLSAVIEREGRLDIPLACRVIADAASALDTAHRAGLIHRDIKPENIMLEGADQRALVMDFGIAKADGPDALKGLTGTGMFLGTPDYMSPEQATGARDIDVRSDQYSLALVAYRMLTGGRAFESDSMQGMMFKRATITPPRVTELNADVPEGVADAISRALSYDPVQRFASMAEFGAAITAGMGLAATGGGATVRRREPDMATRVKEMHAALPGWKHPLVVAAVVGLAAFGALHRQAIARPGYEFGALRNDAVFTAKSWLAARLGGTPEFRFADLVASDSAYRVLQRAYGQPDADARVRKDGLVWRWRSLFRDSAGTPWRVSVAPGNRVVGFVHTIPDSVPRPSVDEATARSLAVAELKAFGITEDGLTWVGDSIIKRKQRSDHVLTWRRRGSEMGIGATDSATHRVGVTVIGDRVERVGQWIDVPAATMKSLGEKSWLVRGYQITSVVVMVLLGIAAMVVVVVRQRSDAMQWKLGLRLVAVFGVFVVPMTIYSLVRQTESTATAAPDNALWSALLGVGILIVFGGGMILAATVGAESLAAELRPRMFGGVHDLLRGRLRIPEMAVAATHGTIAGAVALGAMALADYAAVRWLGVAVRAESPDMLSVDPLFLEVWSNVGPAIFIALALCFALVAARRLRTPDTIAIAVVALLAGGVGNPNDGYEALGLVAASAALTIAAWHRGLLAAFVAAHLLLGFRPVFALATTGSWSTTPLWIAIGLAIALTPLALGVSAYLLVRQQPVKSTATPVSR